MADSGTASRRLPAAPLSGQARLGHAATRRMCAGVYVDHVFRDKLLGNVYNDVNRRVAPSYGFDVVVVLQHAWNAWWLELAEHVVLLVFLVLVLVRAPFDTVIAVSVLVVWAVLRDLLAWADVVKAYVSGRKVEPDVWQMRARGKMLGLGLAASLLVLAGAMIGAARFSGTAGRLDSAWPARIGLEGAGVILAVCAGIAAAAIVVRVACLARIRRHDPPRQRRRGRRLQVIGDQQHHPFTVYTGFKPFIGSGINARSWSFAQRLIRHKALGTEPDQEYDRPPFTAPDLIGRLQQMMTSLRNDKYSDTQLPGMTVADHVFVEGTHAAPFRQVLQSEAASQKVRDAIADAVANPGNVARHYLECRVESWGGEVVTSVFVHVSLQGRTLYLEFSTYALLPTRAEYHLIDEAGGTGPGAVARMIGTTLLSFPQHLLAIRRAARAPVQIWAAIRPRQDLSPRPRAISRFDIGAAVSAREAAAVVPDESYFQYQDSLQHSKIIERRLIATVGDYLKELGVDTSEFWERARAILNTGVINAGPGTVNITGSAVGEQASVTTPSPPAQGEEP